MNVVETPEESDEETKDEEQYQIQVARRDVRRQMDSGMNQLLDLDFTQEAIGDNLRGERGMVRVDDV